MTNASLIEQARAVRLEDEAERRRLVLRPCSAERVGPCPVCGGRDRFAINVRRQVWNCRGCRRGGDVLDFVQHLDKVGFRAAVETLTGERPAVAASLCREPQPRTSRPRSDLWRRLWREASTNLSLVSAFLEHRGLILPDIVAQGGAIRFHPRCWFTLDDGRPVYLPAMIAAMSDPVTGELRGIHRTALASDGRGKAVVPGLRSAKQMLGECGGMVVRLSADETVTTSLALSEGIENGIAALCGGWSPVWAAGSATNLTAFPVLAGIEALTLFADRGPVGEAAADACGQRWADAGCEVEARFPTAGDWNDCLGRAA